MKKVFLLFISLVALLSAHSQAGSLDPSFAGKGWTTTNFYTGNVLDEEGSQVLLLNNGTYLVLFETGNYAVLARYLSKSNNLDENFGTGGYSAPIKLQRPKAALQSDGKIVVSGGVYNPATDNEDFGLARFNPNGSLDVSFGTNGLQITDFGSYEYANAIAIQSDGKIVAAGGIYDPTSNNEDFAIVRYTTAGLLDNDFSEDGLQTTDFGTYDYARALAIQSDGKIVVGGQVEAPASGSDDIGLARYNTDGSLDNTFDGDGKQITDFGGDNNYAHALAIRNNKLYVGGRSNGLMRLGAVAVYSLGTVLPTPPANTLTSANGSAVANEQNLAQKLTVKVLSNPSTTYFTVVIQSNSDKAVSLRMVDAVGRVVEGKGGMAANSSLRIGHSYRPGVYFVQVMQGGKAVTLKLIKQGY